MIKNYFKIAWRNIFKNKTYSFINVGGLALGLAVAFIMLLWVNNEYSMNKYHTNADRIYQVNAKLKFGNDMAVWENTPAPVAVYAKANLSDIEQTARLKINSNYKQVVKLDNKLFVEDNIAFSENELFKIFDLPIIAGNNKEPFAKGLSVILTESTAKKYFGSEEAVGKILEYKDTVFVVSAVMKDFPENSSIRFDVLFSLDIIKLKFRGNGQWKTIDEDWGNYNYSTFCLMKKGAGTANSSAAILKELKKINPEAGITAFIFRPLKNMYLYKADGSKGRVIMVEIFFIIAIFVLVIACINYVNLVTARATQRIKEISIRKIIGADKQQLFWQFFIETGVLLLMAAGASLLLTKLLLPVYQQVSGNNVTYDIANWSMWKVLLTIVGSVWFLTGLYPAFLLSSFKPLESLKGKSFLSNAGALRKGLVVIQFVVSITLILSTVFIHQQMNYIQQRDLHVKTDNVIAFPIWKIQNKQAEFKTQLQQATFIASITSANTSLFEGTNTTTDISWPDKPKDEDMAIAQIEVDNNFMNFFKVQLKEGAGFDKLSPARPNYILNETAVKKMGLKNPVGKTITFHNEPATIIGVVKDFNFESLHKELSPMIMSYDTANNSVIYVHVQQKDAQKTIELAQQIWKQYEPALPLEYAFVDDNIAKQYDKETRASKLFDAFAWITMFISCLGLFGLATHSAERRIKEIGIRKVLGADIIQIAALLSKEFVVLVSVAILIAIPIVWIGMDKLLNYFAYRITLQWWVVLATSVAAIITAVATVSFQTVRAAMVNPVKSLRTE